MAWTRADTITIDHTKVPNTDQTNFPVLVSGAFTNLKTTGNGGVVTSASGYDIIFAADSAGATPYNFERVSWDGTTGACEFWVQVPTVSHTADTTFYCLNGNSAITTDQQNATAVWDANFLGVYHGNTAAADSTTITGGTNHSTTTTTSPAQIGTAGAYSGSSQYIDLGTGVTLGGAGATFETWAYLNSNTASSSLVGIMAKGQWGGDANGDIRLVITAALKMSFQVGNSGSVGTAATDSNTAATGAWHHWVGVWGGGTNGPVTLYKDGASVATTNITGTVTNNAHSLFFGAYPNQIAGTSLNGYLDECRISNTPRSADWIATCYNNQSSPSTFWTTTLSGANPENVSKLIAYSVLDKSIGLNASKLVGYGVLDKSIGVNISKLVAYAVLSVPPPFVAVTHSFISIS